MPWKGPGDLDNRDGSEPPDVRAQYLYLYKTEPRLFAAINSSVASIASLEVTVHAADEERPEDVRAAQFIDTAIRTSRNGWHGLIRDVLKPGMLNGWSVGEIKCKLMQTGEFSGWYGLDHVRNLNTEFIKLQLDNFRNIVGVVSLIRGVQDFDPAKCVVYSHNPIYSNPFGQSVVRPAFRAANLIREVYQVWFVALKRYGLPYMHGKVANQNERKMMEQALADIQAAGWGVTGKDDEILVLNLAAAASGTGFESALEKFTEDINLAVRGSSTITQPGTAQGDQVRGNTDTSRETGSDPLERMTTADVCQCLNNSLIPVLMQPHVWEFDSAPPLGFFTRRVGMPIVKAAGTNFAKIKETLDVYKLVEDSGRKIQSKLWYKTSNTQPADPKDPMDANILAQPAGAGPGQPGGAATPPAIGAGAAPTKPDGGNPAKPPDATAPKQLPAAKGPTASPPEDQGGILAATIKELIADYQPSTM